MYEIFEKLLKERGLKVSDFCKATGLSAGTMSDWKSGRYALKAEKLKIVADFFGVSVEYIMTGKQPENYYLNPETAAIAQQVYDNPELRMLFDAARGVGPDSIKLATEMLRRFKETNPDG